MTTEAIAIVGLLLGGVLGTLAGVAVVHRSTVTGKAGECAGGQHARATTRPRVQGKTPVFPKDRQYHVMGEADSTPDVGE